MPDVEVYKSLPSDSPEARELTRRIAANIGDYASLRLVLGIDPPEFARFYPDMETATPDTIDTIDSFLDKFGKDIPVSGYMATQDIETQTEKEKEKNLQDLIKSHRYEDAMRLIEAQNLNNPIKSIYFAHQIRFLKKLIAIENFKKLTQG